MRLTEDEFRSFVESPVFQRLWAIGADVREGRADEETIAAWEALQETLRRLSQTVERVTARFEPQDREAILQAWIDEWAGNYWTASDHN